MKELSSVIEGFFNNVGATGHILELKKLGFECIGTHNDKECYHAKLKGQDEVLMVKDEYNWNERKVITNPDLYIVPDAYISDKSYYIFIVWDECALYTCLYDYRGNKVKPNKAYEQIVYIEATDIGRKTISNMFADVNNYINYDDILFNCSSICEFDEIELPKFIEKVFMKVLKIDLND